MSSRPGEGASRRSINVAAAEHLLNGYRAPLMALASRNTRSIEDAEDALARTVELALRSCPINDDMAQVEAWARVVCRREAWKIGRRYRRKPTTSLDGLAEGAAHGEAGPVPVTDRNQASPEERALDAETAREVGAAIERLPEGQRGAIRRYARGWGNREIAQALGRSERSVRKALWRGKRTLRARLAA